MSIPEDVAALVGVPMYVRVAERPADLRTALEVCAATQNANPLFWDADAADRITAGPVLPPSTLSVWMRPMSWRPDLGSLLTQPLQLHFDLKERFGLPDAVMTATSMVFHEPVRPGDVIEHHQMLRSVSETTNTSLGDGRFWDIDVEYRNQRYQLVGVETYTGFGYRPSATSGVDG